MSVKLSICIATYNRGKFIGDTLESILSQMQPGVEIIVVDGASPDNTSEVMAQLLSRYSGIRYYREEDNSGVDRDYDKAVGYATGEYCWLMTDDDLLCAGAISRVLGLLDGTVDLIVVNAEIRSADLSKELHVRFLGFLDDREYGAGNRENFFSEVATYLSFIGCVVVHRKLWMERDRTAYFGTLFVHVGVIFQHPPIEKIKVVADPSIIIRYGNAMWSARGFEIWMFRWPKLIWSFGDYSDEAKSHVCPREPWRLLKNLAFYRANGGYTMTEYRRFLFDRASGVSRVFPFLIAIAPAFLVNTLASLYCIAVKRGASAGVYDLARSRHATWISRLVARILNVDIG